jgi:hypothetical protein
MTSFVAWLTALWIHAWWLPAGWPPAGPATAVVNRVCHDARAGVVVAQVHGTYRRYCGVPPERVREWLGADSMGRFHATFVGGRFPCPNAGNGPAAWNAHGVGRRVAMR